MAEKRSVSDRMGIAFLTETEPPAELSPETTPASFEQTVVDRSSRALANWTVLSTLDQLGAHDHPVKMSEVADTTRSRADILLPIEDSLVTLGWIEVADTTPFGDDSVKLTDNGAAIAQGGPADIVKLGEL